MTVFQRILINTERWNETVVTPSLVKPHELISTPNNFPKCKGPFRESRNCRSKNFIVSFVYST